MIEVIAKARYQRGTDLASERDQVVAFKRTQELINTKDYAVVFMQSCLCVAFGRGKKMSQTSL